MIGTINCHMSLSIDVHNLRVVVTITVGRFGFLDRAARQDDCCVTPLGKLGRRVESESGVGARDEGCVLFVSHRDLPMDGRLAG